MRLIYSTQGGTDVKHPADDTIPQQELFYLYSVHSATEPEENQLTRSAQTQSWLVIVSLFRFSLKITGQVPAAQFLIPPSWLV